MIGFRVGPDGTGRRLDLVLADHLGCSRSQAARHLDRGEVRVDGRVAAKNHRAVEGQQVVLEVADPGLPGPAPALPPVRYEDEHLLVLAKPAGLVVHPGAGHVGDTLVQALQAAGVPLASAGGPDRPGIVHRLDRDTTGLLVVAKSDRAHGGLVEALAGRTVTRRYLAVVEGVPAAPVARIEAPLGRDPRNRKRFAVVVDGKPATTRYRLLASGQVGEPAESVSALACGLETGRTHQIRVHLSRAGHPLVGDPLYGARRRMAVAAGIDRPALHAAHLAFTHPVTGQPVRVSEPLPADLAEALVRSGMDAEAVWSDLLDPPAPEGGQEGRS